MFLHSDTCPSVENKGFVECTVSFVFELYFYKISINISFPMHDRLIMDTNDPSNDVFYLNKSKKTNHSCAIYFISGVQISKKENGERNSDSIDKKNSQEENYY